MINNGEVVFNRSNSLSVANDISGSGSLTKQGAATLTLTGNNGYTGTTTIAAGTLQIGNGGTTGTLGTGGVQNSGTLIFNRSNDVTVAAAIGGTGSVVKSGAGTATFTGNNSYTGTTTINAGTLQLGNGGTSGTLGSGNVVNNGLLSFNRSDSVTIANDISGTGGVSQVGSGTTTLTGVNSYTGSTTVSNGMLVLGNGGSVTGNVVNNGVFGINRSDSFVLSALISGSGELAQLGSGTTTLTADNTYTGGTTIAAGALRVGDGGTTGRLGTGEVVNNAALIIDRSDAVTLGNAIRGAGSLTKLGSNTLVLSGANTYTGTTLNSGGTLQVGDGGTAGTLGSGAVVNVGVLAFNRSDELSVSGDISGAGSVLQMGLGRTVLTGHNTYAGGTVIQSGALQVGAGGISGSLTGDVVNNGALVFDRADSITFQGDTAGRGTLIHAGDGKVVLTGRHTHSGGTVIASGTLQIGDGGTKGSLAGSVENDGVIAFDRSDTVAFDGDVRGDGQVLQAGAGTTVLTGTNTYTGGTKIAAGTLQIGDGGTRGSIVGDVDDDGTLVFNRADLVTFDGDISGSGSVVQAGPGTTILRGVASYTGGTVVRAGTLRLADSPEMAGVSELSGASTLAVSIPQESGDGELAGAILNDGVLVFNKKGSFTVRGGIAGSGTVVHAGAGTLALSGAHTHTGGTRVESGTLLLDGALSSRVDVKSGAAFSGSGSVAGPVTVEGTIQPGSPAVPFGTLALAGDLEMSAGSQAVVAVDATGQHASLSSGGAITFTDTSLVIDAQAGDYRPRDLLSGR